MAKRKRSHNPKTDTPDPPSLPLPGSEEALKEEAEILQEYAVETILTGGDVDADWKGAQDVGDEAVGGHAPTPDQDDVDAIGRAFGIEQQDNQELHTHDEILEKRDKERWELDRRSEEEEEERETPA
jgi:hypothetical protein